MSILNDAFDSLTPLYNSLGEETSNSIEHIFDEPLYIEHSTMSGVEERPLFKRTQSMRMNSMMLETLIEEEKSSEIENFIPFMAKITDHVKVNISTQTWKWYYSWEEMRLDDTTFTYDSIITRDGAPIGEAGDDSTRAINIMEWNNSENCVAPGVCVNMDNCSYPQGWEPRAIGDCQGSLMHPIVIMYKVRQNDLGSYRYIFQAENAHDGTCPTDIIVGP